MIFDPIKKTYQKIEPSQYDYSQVTGYWPKKNASLRHIVRTEEKILYDVIYNTDEYGRRKIPIFEKNFKDKHMVFFGDSFVWGTGVRDDQTLPYFAGLAAPNYHVYNYGLGGSGPHQMLALIQDGKLPTQIQEPSGVFIYVAMDFHIKRAQCHMIECQWLDRSPYYELNSEGRPVRKGDFLNDRRWTTIFYDFLYNTVKLPHWAGRNFPWTNEDDVTFTCALIKETERELKRQFPSSEFYVLLHPLRPSPKLQSCLASFHLKHIAVIMEGNGPWEIPYDKHPNARANEMIGNKLVTHFE